MEETVAGDECCVGSDGWLEMLLIPDVWLALSGKIMGVWIKRHGGRKEMSQKWSQQSKSRVRTKRVEYSI